MKDECVGMTKDQCSMTNELSGVLAMVSLLCSLFLVYPFPCSKG